MIDIKVALTGVPQTIDTRLTGVDYARLVRVQEAGLAGLQTLVNEGKAAAAGAPTVTAPADAPRNGTARLHIVAKKSGEVMWEHGESWHKLSPEHAKFIGDAFAELDDAAAKG